MSERRRYRRIKTSLENKYTKIRGCATIQSTSITSDISIGGICAKLGNMVRRKDILLVEFNSKNKEKLTTLTEVAWIKPSSTCRGNFCGLRFLWVSSERLLEECIDHAGMRSAA